MSAFTPQDITALANRAIAKIDGSGRRGASMVTFDEIEAMACLIVALRAARQTTNSQNGETHDG